MQASMGQINAATTRTGSAFSNLGGVAAQLGGALGVSFGIAGAVQLGRYALAAEKVATAYGRQSVAALGLAGSQEKLNDLLAVYDRVTGGAVDKATALGDVTRLMAVGMADSSAELEKFVTAARGISVAMGSQQGDIINELQLAISNQSIERLDQLGLSSSEVRDRIKELQGAQSGLTREMAFQEAIIGLATEKYGKLAESAEAQATGAEKAAKAWKDLRLEIGKSASGPADRVARSLAQDLDILTEAIERNRKARAVAQTGTIGGGLSMQTNRAGAESILAGLNAQRERVLADQASGDRSVAATTADLAELDIKIRAASVSLAGLSASAARATGNVPGAPPWMASVNRAMSGTETAPRFSEDETGAIRERWDAMQDIEENALKARTDAVRQYGEQMASTQRTYGKTMAREQEDFNRGRLRAEQEFAESILDIRQDAARREAKQAEDLARMIGDARADSAERVADWEADHGERIAEARENAAERLIELEEDYQKSRERAAEAHADRLLDAAGRLDAKAVYEEQRNFARQEADAKEAHDEQISELQAALQELVDQENESYAERLADEAESLDNRIRQANEAAARQLADAQAADELRIADMTADFEDRKILEDSDRALRLERMAIDHQDQMDEMARQHELDLEQIRIDKQAERDATEEEFNKAIEDLSIANSKWIAENKRVTDAAIADWDRTQKNIALGITGLLGLSALQGSHPSMGDPYINRQLSGGGRSVTIAPNITINESKRPGETAEEVRRIVLDILAEAE